MKYVLTGSLGHISKLVTQQLIQQGHSVTLISSKAENAQAIEQLGALPAIGNVEDQNFLDTHFAGADAVYLMIPPNFAVTNWLAYQQKVADNYVQAVKHHGIKKVVLLSSIGAHMKQGAGPVDGLAYLEDVFNELDGVDVLALRPSYFYYNLFSMVGLIKHAGIMGGTQSAEHEMVLTHTNDIAQVAVEKLSQLDFVGKTVQYIASDVKTWGQITEVLSAAIDKPGLPWVEFTDEQSLQGMLQAGLSPVIAEGYVQMGQAIRSGEMEADYKKNPPAQLGKIKLEDFSKEFAAVYQAS
jgi:uncharacterized protein YbjT (DUF2867 family)